LIEAVSIPRLLGDVVELRLRHEAASRRSCVRSGSAPASRPTSGWRSSRNRSGSLAPSPPPCPRSERSDRWLPPFSPGFRSVRRRRRSGSAPSAAVGASSCARWILSGRGRRRR
jgi:hypothetical protein